MALVTIALSLVGLALIFQAWLGKRNSKVKKLPPGPKGLPIIGCLHLLGKYPQRALHDLAKKHGPLMHMRLGFVPTIVVSSPKAAELFLKTHDLVFASRPPVEAAKYIGYDQTSISFSPYGPYWRNMRKLCTLELLSNLKVNSFRSLRKEEIDLLVDSIKQASYERVSVNLSAKVSSLGADISCRMVFGKKYTDKEFGDRGFTAVIHDSMQLIAAPNLADYIPLIAQLDLQGLRKRMKAVSKVFDGFLEKIIDDHIQNKNENRTKDFVDILFGFLGSQETEYSIVRDNIKAVMLDMLVASMDTSTTVVEWALSELVKNPQIMKKLQKELDGKVTLDRMVEESDLEGLNYLDMVIKETFRLHPVAPLLVPHMSTEDITIEGFHIPKNSRVFINIWAIGRDPTVWSDAETFIPERLVGSNIDFRGQDFELLPFGSGRRSCPGMQMGMINVRLILARLVHSFDWELPDGKLPSELDMTEVFSLVTPRATPLLAIPTYRLTI
ncbi:hypothetical protein K2173_025868 [Erythroxylum novogranatense]|uniref:Cytochrome P450 n=1 Tax=Erythroxylum novogranatense TaxID=1862640 RepID=A0AAV8TW32_9ROSI|nr:hypothetical protein K2173_025868 [Erythroxylum novogranatense]